MVVGVDTNADRRQIGERFGITHFVNPKQLPAGGLVGHLVELTSGGATEADVGAEGLAALLDAHEAGRREVPVTTPVAAPEMIEALRQLGYIE
jgi:Zn-dependent alcohol dehydrogenase